MGNTLTQWQAKVSSYLRDAGETTATVGVITASLRTAFMRYSSDRPRQIVEEVEGAGSAYFDLPAGWVAGVSHLDRIEQPARRVPPSFLDDKAWLLTRSPDDVTLDQILLAVQPSANTFVRFHYSAPWPFPTNDDDDLVDATDDLAFEAVSALAASYVITGLDLDAARRRAELAKDPDAKAGGIPDQSLLSTAKAYEALYLRFLGIDPDTPGTTTTGPFSVTVDYDPQSDSIFHGGPR